MDNQSENGMTGRCLCGAVDFKIDGKLRPVSNCHCSQCRKTTGHFGAFTAVDRKDLSFNEDKGLKWFQSSESARRGFCQECGSTLFFDMPERDIIAIAAGSLETPTGLSTSSHIFVDDKGDYYEISDDLPQHAQYWK